MILVSISQTVPVTINTVPVKGAGANPQKTYTVILYHRITVNNVVDTAVLPVPASSKYATNILLLVLTTNLRHVLKRHVMLWLVRKRGKLVTRMAQRWRVARGKGGREGLKNRIA
jgi:hypothetical protein